MTNTPNPLIAAMIAATNALCDLAEGDDPDLAEVEDTLLTRIDEARQDGEGDHPEVTLALCIAQLLEDAIN